MQIASLAINNLRILKNFEIEPCPGINFVFGDNGAGKTSVLEGIYLAGRGRTFRHADAGPMIRAGADSVTVVVVLNEEGSGRQSTLGIRREKRALTCRLDGQDVRKRSSLAEALPLQWIGSQPQLFLGMGPEVRRRFIDMGLFHVEHSYLGVMGEFQRILRQRNAAIRQGNVDTIKVWNRPFAKAAEEMHQHRLRFVEDLMQRVSRIQTDWQPSYLLEYRYRAGWNPEEPLLEQLNSKIELDLRMGYTTRGPQRAELDLVADGGSAEKKLSRGQQKILVLTLNLALMDLMVERQGRAPVLLIDDLAAELDPLNRERIMGELERRGGQVFLTKIEDGALVPPHADAKTFHVEHGTLG